MRSEWDILVIGGGHAGIEAAWAASRLGARTGLVTLDPGVIGQMSCNPAIGGVGKGQIVREIDAMGGLMGQAADATGIQFRMLNRSKGPAVWGPRCQSDRHAYAAWTQAALAEAENLTILVGEAVGIETAGGRVVGVRVAPSPDHGAGEGPCRDGLDAADECSAPGRSAHAGGCPAGAVERIDAERVLRCDAAIVTAGTFLRGVMHLGPATWPGGRVAEPAAGALSDSLRRAGIELGRLKTGTCARLDGRTIDTSRCTAQPGDEEPRPFSFLTERLDAQQVPCWLTATTPAVHELVRANFGRAPLYTGQIASTGPRYCPSIETKVERFADKTSHLVFLEPEGRGTHWVYCNGISTSLPVDVQAAMIAGIPGLERARVLRWGYAIEYDFAQPTQLTAELESKAVAGLYLAGQVNGTTGYEEAAGQGLLAGLSAARRLAGHEGIVLRRDQAYLGVMIDDLVTRGVSEPYRMFTSRAEHRLSLRADNADRRLTPTGIASGLVDRRRREAFERKMSVVKELERLLGSTRRGGRSLWELLRRPDLTWEALLADHAGPAASRLVELRAESPDAVETVLTDGRYAGYLDKARADAVRLAELEAKRIPPELNYFDISHLRHEAREKLSAVRPRNLGQASRISGITPADVAILAVRLAKPVERTKEGR